MKQIYSTCFLLFCFSLLIPPLYAQDDCTIIFDGRQNNLRLANGDVFCIPAGKSFTGKVKSMAQGAIIRIDSLAVFAPRQANQIAGTIVNKGQTQFSKAVNLVVGAEIINEGEMVFENSLNLNGSVQIKNLQNAELRFLQAISFQTRAASFTNEGSVHFQSLNTAAGFSFVNRGRMETEVLNVDGGFTNYGFLLTQQNVNINANATFINYCTFVAQKLVNNNSPTTRNEGFIWLMKEKWSNNADLYNAESGSFRGIDFVNNASVKGAGEFYFTGTTRNNGQFGTDGLGINFYDTNAASQLMDYPYGTIDPSVSNQAFSPADTTTWCEGCDQSFLTSILNDYQYLGNYNSNGLPDYLDGRDTITDATFAMINKVLPELAPVPDFHPEYLENVYNQDIKLLEDAEVWISFVGEGAGYKNVLGFYVYDTLSPPQGPPNKEDITIVFPNVSALNSGGELQTGDRVKLGSFKAGQAIAWVLIANGWDNTSVTDGLWKIHSNANFNLGKDSSLRKHNVMLYDANSEQLLLGFEDILRERSGSDEDFNDAMFFVKTEPSTAIATEDLLLLPESNCNNGIDEDGDGLIDCDDPDCQTASNACVQDEFFTQPTNTGLDIDARSTWGAAWGDYDGDGWEDLLVTEYAHWWSSYLYRNNQDGTFTKVEAGPITTDQGSNVGVTWGDYDNDGDLDLFAANNVRAVNHLYRNDGGGNFTKVDGGSISQYSGYCHSAAWADYDNDGFLDLFVADFMPTKFNLLYHNEGDGTFTQANQTPVMMDAKSTMSGAWGDYDNDGLIDLFVPQAREANNTLYHNKGNGHFERILTGDIVNDGGNSLGASWGDFDNDGDLDLYVTNASFQNNFFYENQGDGSFVKDTTSIIANEPGHSFGSSWGDVDNDGDLDLYVVNDNGNPNRLYINDGGGDFSVQYNSIVNTTLANSATATFTDYDKDGDLDLFVGNNQYQENVLYQNQKGSYYRWKTFKLEGVQSNRSAIGAKVYVKAKVYGNSRWQMREVSSQTGGVSAQNSLYVHFGLGDATQIDSVRVIWPSGNVQNLGPQGIDDYQTIIEPTGQRIFGTAFVDANNNCEYDFGERLIANLPLKVLPDGKALATDKDGRFSFYRTQGKSLIVQDTSSGWNQPCFTEINIEIANETGGNSGGGSSIANPNGMGIELPNQGGTNLPDLNLAISSTALRRGFRNSYALTYFNMSTVAAERATLAVEFDKDIIPLSATHPWDSVYDNGATISYFWRFDSIPAFEGQTILITDSVSAEAVMGKNTLTLASIGSSGMDMDFSDNIVHDYNTVVGAIDPNDILVSPEGDISTIDSLTYTIRFQNVGTAPAQRVLILDTLSQHLEWASLNILEVSHDYEMSVSEEGLLRFVFDYIFLADSNSNEPESHGFIRYQILPKANSSNASVIENRAAIQFDYNEFLITNTVENRIRSFNFDVQKSGENAELIWVLSAMGQAGYFEIERSLDGNTFGKLANIELQADQLEYRTTDLGVGKLPLKSIYYRVKLVLEDGRTQYSDALSLNLAEEVLEVFVQGYPNPFGRYLNIEYNNPYNQKVNLQIVSSLGVPIYQTNALPANGALSVDTQNWSSGYYYLSLGDGQHKQTFKLQKR